MIFVTDQAAAALAQMLRQKNASADTGLRLGVERGGCAGLQYTMSVGLPVAEDSVTVHPSGVRVFVAADSVQYLEKCQLDYSDSLSDAGFKIINPNATRSCGCGTSFETEKEPASALPSGQSCD